MDRRNVRIFPNNPQPVIDFLTDIWDTRDEVYIGGDSYITRPYYTLFGCVTPTGLKQTFNQDSWQQGFLTRTIMVGGSDEGRRFNPLGSTYDPRIMSELVDVLERLQKNKCVFTVTQEAGDTLMEIEEHQPRISDARLTPYYGRRVTQHVKLSMCLAAMRNSPVIELEDILYSNTLLTFTESRMPDSLGEFGSTMDVVLENLVLKALRSSQGALTAEQIHNAVSETYTGHSVMDRSWVTAAMQRLISRKAVHDLKSTGKENKGLFSIVEQSVSGLKTLKGIYIFPEYFPEWSL